MSHSSESSIFSFPINSPECKHEIYEIEKTAVKALKNINLIYNEVMSPKECSLEDPEVTNLNSDETFEGPSYSCNKQNHYLKTCCSTLKELCVKCDRIVTLCSSCNQCNCLSNGSNKKIKNYEISQNISATYRPHSARGSDYKFKCTVPKPFSFNDKIKGDQMAKENKISKLRQELEKEIEEELKIRADIKPVPKTTHLPLYSKMVEKQQKVKVKRKEKGLEILSSAKPFNLQTTKHATKAKSSSDLASENVSNFRAKPVPKHILSEKVTAKLKNKEEVRKMLMIERAKQIKEQSSSPFSQRPITFSRSLVNLFNLNKPPQNNEESKPRNISEITKRLYIKKCNETMENWNKKVMLVDNCKKNTNQENQNLLTNESEHKKQLSKNEELPFMYFPVRMSNAAILREKQIRTEILAREEREKRRKEDELAKKKANFDILNKLRGLIPSPEGEKEIDEKVKTFRESQTRRKLEYEKELEEIMKRVAEQKLLLEKQSKIEKSRPKSFSQNESEADTNEQESIESDTNEEESSATNSNQSSSTKS